MRHKDSPSPCPGLIAESKQKESTGKTTINKRRFSASLVKNAMEVRGRPSYAPDRIREIPRTRRFLIERLVDDFEVFTLLSRH